VGDRRWPASQRLQAQLAEDGIGHQWLDPAEDAAARILFAEAGGDGGTTPVVIRPDGRVLSDPTRDDLLLAAGSATRDLTST
jgi:hypothetical protein